MVAYFHVVGQVPAFTRYLAFNDGVDSAHLSSGVYIFFVISGFIMYVTGRELSAGEFAWRRLTRIIPLYWVVTLVVCVVALTDPGVFHRTDLTLAYLVKSLLFIPYADPTQQGLLFPILVPGWSLNYEMFFYAIFAASLLFPARLRMWLAGGVIAAAALSGVIRSRPELGSIYGFYTGSHVLLFGFGLLLGAAHSRLRARAGGMLLADRRPRLPRWVCGTLLITGFWVLLADFHNPEIDRLAQFFGSVAVVSGAVAWEYQYGLPRWRFLLLLGDASYSIYLVHIFAFGFVRQLWKHVPLYTGAGALAFGLVSMLMAIALALVTYQLVEKPSVRWSKRIGNGRRERAISPPFPSSGPAVGIRS